MTASEIWAPGAGVLSTKRGGGANHAVLWHLDGCTSRGGWSRTVSLNRSNLGLSPSQVEEASRTRLSRQEPLARMARPSCCSTSDCSNQEVQAERLQLPPTLRGVRDRGTKRPAATASRLVRLWPGHRVGVEAASSELLGRKVLRPLLPVRRLPLGRLLKTAMFVFDAEPHAGSLRPGLYGLNSHWNKWTPRTLTQSRADSASSSNFFFSAAVAYCAGRRGFKNHGPRLKVGGAAGGGHHRHQIGRCVPAQHQRHVCRAVDKQAARQNCHHPSPR